MTTGMQGIRYPDVRHQQLATLTRLEREHGAPTHVTAAAAAIYADFEGRVYRITLDGVAQDVTDIFDEDFDS